MYLFSDTNMGCTRVDTSSNRFIFSDRMIIDVSSNPPLVFGKLKKEHLNLMEWYVIHFQELDLPEIILAGL